LAHDHVGPHPLELWCGKRRVKSLPAEASAADQRLNVTREATAAAP
jgi:hypothetical protein